MRALHGPGVRSKRLDGIVCHVLFVCVSVMLGLGALAFLATRTHMYHVAFHKRRQTLENSMWLVQQCKTSDFYSNMKHHSTICDDVALAETDALWLHALRDVIDETRPCGEHACALRVQQALEWILGRGLLTFGAAIFLLFVLFTLAVQLQRMFASAQHAMPHPSIHCTPYAHSPHAARGGHWYPLLTHTSDDYCLKES
jgi:hypothetical protein